MDTKSIPPTPTEAQTAPQTPDQVVSKMVGKPSGGPAFPSVESVDNRGNPCSLNNGSSSPYIKTMGGMSLRTYFAGQALNGLLASLAGDASRANLQKAMGFFCDDSEIQTIARASCMHADALIAELSKTQITTI